MHAPGFDIYSAYKFEMILMEFDDSLSLHFGEFLGHIGAFQIEVICQLLPVERDGELCGMFFERNGAEIGEKPCTAAFGGGVKTPS
jgi:hypothetical protein